MKEHEKKFLPYCLFGQLEKKVLHRINNIRAQECGLYSDKYKVAGRVDCVAEFDGKLSIIDFKTSSKERNDEWNENYYIQASAYAEMFEERTGIEINQICILVVTSDGVVQEFVKDKKEYVPLIEQTVLEWEMKNEKVKNNNDDFTGAPI
jgi:genome maintenance exonuclease 1